MKELKIYRTLFCETRTGQCLGMLQLGLPSLALGMIGIILIIEYDRHLNSMLLQALPMALIMLAIIWSFLYGYHNGPLFFPSFLLQLFIARNQSLIAQKARERIEYLEELLEKDCDLFAGCCTEYEKEIEAINAEITFLKEQYP